MLTSNMLSRQCPSRRFLYYLTSILCIFYISSEIYHYYSKSSDSMQYASPYNEYIDIKGKYFPYSGYKILQLVKRPLPPHFMELHKFLNQHSELKSYFSFLPANAYHITLTNLKNKTRYPDSQLKILETEQELLDKDDLTTTCSAQQLLIIDENEIRMEVLIQNPDQIKEYQKRWDKKFPEVIIQHYTSFHIVLAYQYQNIPNKEVFNKLEQILKKLKFPFELLLDPVEISLYRDLITYLPIIPDTL